MSRTEKTPEIAAGSEPAGHVEFDSRGNSVWRWNSAVADSTSVVLKRLDNDALQLEPTRSVPVPTRGEGAPQPQRPAEGGPSSSGGDLSVEMTCKVKAGGGFNPYDNS
jgi:hypothetical protein